MVWAVVRKLGNNKMMRRKRELEGAYARDRFAWFIR